MNKNLLSNRFKLGLTLFVVLLSYSIKSNAQTALDVIVFGNTSSESTHSLTAMYSNTYTGQLSQTARRFTPRTDADACIPAGSTNGIYGGYTTFKVSVNGNLQNYFTAKLSGEEFGGPDETNRLTLAVQATDSSFREIGYRHGEPFVEQCWTGVLPGTFFYRTVAIPRTFTDGKSTVTLRIRATGRYYSYAARWDYWGFQRNMIYNSVGVYRGYTHSNPVFSLDKTDVLGRITNYSSSNATIKSNANDATSLNDQKNAVINTVQNYLNDPDDYIPTNSNNYKSEIEYLAVAYNTDWVTNAYHQPSVIQKLVKLIDNDVRHWVIDPGTVGAWGGSFGRPGYAMCLVWNSIKDSLTHSVDLGSGVKLRSSYWGDLFNASFRFALGDRKWITNQALESSMSAYGANMALLQLGDARAWTKAEALKLVHESLGMLEWRGNYNVNTSTFNYDMGGTGFYFMTEKGTSHEPGWVSQDCYGNLGPKIVDLFYMTGDSTILAQAVKHEKAQMHFHIPGIMLDGTKNRAILTEGVICWRNVYHPGKLHYVDPFVVEASKDPELLGVAKQMNDDGMLMNEMGVNDETKSLRIVSAYNIIKAASAGSLYTAKDPTTPGQADFAWGDEENGVVSIKRGNEQVFISFYDKAYVILDRAVAHIVKDSTERLILFNPNLIKYVGSGYTSIDDGRTQPDWAGTPCDNPMTAYKDMVYEVPLLFSGQTNGNRAIANFYASRFGNYVIAMNTTKRSWNTTYSMNMPAGITKGYNLNTHLVEPFSGPVSVAPGTTVVYYLGDSITQNNPVTESIQYTTLTAVTGGGSWNAAATWDGNRVPTSADNVIIPSGVTVTTNAVAVCNSLTINGTLTYNNQVCVMGNLTTSKNLLSTKPIVLTGTLSAQTINTNGFSIDNLIINNSKGVILSNPLTVNSVLTLTNGALSLGANNLTIGSAGSISGASASSYILTNGSGKLVQSLAANANKLFPVGTSSTSYDLATINSRTAVVCSVNVSGTLSGTIANITNTNQKQWNITAASSVIANITLTPSVAKNTVNPVIAQFSNGAWNETPATLNGISFTRTVVTSFTSFATGTQQAFILRAPVNPGIANLTHQWTFDDGNANDAILTNPVNGTLTGGATVVNKALTLTANGQYLSFSGAALALNGYSALSVECWYKSIANANTGYTMLSCFGKTVSTTGQNYFGMATARGDNKSWTCITDGNNTREIGSAGPEYDDGNLHHMVSVLRSDSILLYIDGFLYSKTVLDATRKISAIDPMYAYLAKSCYTADPTWIGTIYKYSIYNKALTPGNIQYLLDIGPEQIPSLVATESFIPLDDISSSKLFAVTGTNLTNPITLTAPAGIILSTSSIPANPTSASVTATYDGTSVVNGNITLTSGSTSFNIRVKASKNSDCFTQLYPGLTNLIVDPTCNSYTTDGWGNKSINTDSAYVYCGSRSGKTTSSGSYDRKLTGIMKINTEYRVKAMVYKKSTSTNTVGVGVYGHNSTLGDIYNAVTATNSWQVVDFTFTSGPILKANQGVYFNYGDGYIDNWEMYEVPQPTIETSSSSMAFDELNSTGSFTLTGSYLKSDITVTAPAGITVNPTSIPAGSASNVTVSVTYNGNTTPVSGNIVLTSGSLVKNVAVAAATNASCFTPLYPTGNKIADPYLNSLSTFAGWGVKSINTDPAYVYCGTKSGKITGVSAGSIDISFPALKSNTRYRMRAMVLTIGGTFRMGMNNLGSGVPNMDRVFNTNGAWQAVDIDFNTGSGTTCNLAWFNNYQLTGTTGYIDNWEFYEVPDIKVSSPSLSYLGAETKKVAVTANNLANTISITAPAGFTISPATLLATAAGDSLTISFDGLTPRTGYVYLTSNAVKDSIAVTGIALNVITFPVLLAKLVGDADFTPGATASSGLAVSYASSNVAVATIVNSNIHIVGAGTSVITASQVGDASYNVATDVTQTLTVTATVSYKIKNRSTALYIDGMGRTVNGNAAAQGISSTSTNQNWIIETVGSYVKLKNVSTGLYIDGMGLTTSGSVANQWSSSTSPNQQWLQVVTSGYTRFKNRATGLYLDGMGLTTNGSNLGQKSNSTTNKSQQWTLTQNVALVKKQLTIIQDQEQSEIEIYPNPVRDFIHIENSEGATVQIYSVFGTMVYSSKITDTNQTIDLSKLTNGIYFVKLIDKGIVKNAKVIKN